MWGQSSTLDILDNFHIITDGMHNITEQANENKGVR